MESSRAPRASLVVLALVSLTALAAACGSSSGGAPDDGSGGAGTSGSNGTPSGNGSGGAGSGLPCDVAAVLATNCGDCHTSPPKYGAPMPLVDLDDLHAAAVSDPERQVWELVKERIADPVKTMPPSGDLPESDRAVLDAWLGAGAPAASDDGCGAGGAGSGGAGDVGPDALPCTPTHVFTAHAEGSDEPFHVPEQGADNLYQCFTFKSPFNGTTQATAWAPITDDERVLHHWILYRTKTAQADEGVQPCAMPADATFVSGWAPGGTNFVFPENIGLELAGPDDWFILQVHYHNSAHHPDALDKSGVALCTTDTPREHDAGVVTLGTVGIDVPPHAMGHEETGTCPSWITGYLTEPLHIIASFPHMHELGRKFRTDILRGGSESMLEPLVEVDHFSFEDQTYYAHEPEVMLQPGDALRTTCTYDNPGNTAVKFGEKTEDEMCFNFAMVYPVSSIGDNRQCGLF